MAVISALSLSSSDFSSAGLAFISPEGDASGEAAEDAVSSGCRSANGSYVSGSAPVSAGTGSPGGVGEDFIAACARRCISITRMAASRCICAKLSNCCIMSPLYGCVSCCDCLSSGMTRMMDTIRSASSALLSLAPLR